MEYRDIYDRERIFTGKATPKTQPLEKGEYRLVVHVCIFNSKNEMLIQQRQSFDKSWPNAWDFSVAGGVSAGETSWQGGEREAQEELGLKIDLSNTRPYMTINYETGFDDIYLIEKDVDLSTLNLQKEEVQAVKWASEQEILDMIKSKNFINYYPSFVSAIFEMRAQRGLHNQK